MSTRELFSSEPPRSARPFTGVSVSVALHVVFAVGIYLAGAYLGRVSTPETLRPSARRLTFVNVTVPPDVAVKRPRLKVPEIPREVPRPAPKVELHRAEIQPPPPEPLPREVAPAPKPKPVVQQVTVGSFSAPAAQVRTKEISRLVQSSDFDSPSSKALSPEMKLGNAVVGAFQTAAADGPRSTGARPTQIADAGFGQVGLDQKQPSRARTLGDAGFGESKQGERPQAPTRVAQVQEGAFSNLDAPPPPSRRPTPERVETTVEIILKPTPEYTSEARSRKVEGEVTLEVEFRASGEVRVLRVVRGLGYGLDESAARAAERIRFKPARTSSGPIDSRATIQIVFRLT